MTNRSGRLEDLGMEFGVLAEQPDLLTDRVRKLADSDPQLIQAFAAMLIHGVGPISNDEYTVRFGKLLDSGIPPDVLEKQALHDIDEARAEQRRARIARSAQLIGD